MHKKDCFADKKNKNGFSIVELIVVIAIMTVLTGVVAPLFVKYVGENRTKACIQNRDAILNVYQKSVYAGFEGAYDGNELDDAALQAIIDTDTGNEYAVQSDLYAECPSGGHYVGKLSIDKTKAYITCSEHADDISVVDFTGWIGEYGDADDDDYPIPTKEPEPFPSAPPQVTPGPTPSPPVTGDSGVWPYRIDLNGNIDERWSDRSTIGPASGSVIYIPIPQCAYFGGRSGADFVFVQAEINKNGQIYYKLEYEKATSPESLQVNDNSFIVKLSGLKYEVDMNDLAKSSTSMPPVAQMGGSAVNVNTEYYFGYGDVVTVKFADGKTKSFVKTDQSNTAKLPSSDYADAVWGKAGGQWAVVPDKKVAEYIYHKDTKSYTIKYTDGSVDTIAIDLESM